MRKPAGREAADRALSLLGGSQCESMNCPVVMDPFVTSSLIGVIGSVLTGEAVQKQRSMFAGLAGPDRWPRISSASLMTASIPTGWPALPSTARACRWGRQN